MRIKKEVRRRTLRNLNEANIIKALGIIVILIPTLFVGMFLLFTWILSLDITSHTSIITISILLGIWLLVYIVTGILVVIKIENINWQDKELIETKAFYWIPSLVFLIIPIPIIGAIFWIAWGVKASKISDLYQPHPKHKEFNPPAPEKSE